MKKRAPVLQVKVSNELKHNIQQHASTHDRDVSSIVRDAVSTILDPNTLILQVPAHTRQRWVQFAEDEGLDNLDALLITAVNDYVRDRGGYNGH